MPRLLAVKINSQQLKHFMNIQFSIILNYFKKNLTENTKNYLLIFFVTMVVTFFYFSPYLVSALRNYKPELRFVGDLQLAGYPSFIQTGKYFHDWIFKGIDFFTANGSSSLFMRPNFPVYYLPQLILQTIFNISNNDLSAKLFMIQLWLNGFIAMLFTTLWLNKIAKIDIYSSLLGGTLFFSIVAYVYSQIAFLNVVCVFPALMYCLSISLTQKTDIYQKILLSIPLVMILTAGYLPIATMGVLVAIIASLVICKCLCFEEQQRYKDFFIVLALGLLVLSGYLLAIVNAVSIVPAIPKIPLIETLFFSDLSLKLKGVMTIFFSSIPNDSGEGPHFRLGLPVFILIYVVYQHLASHANTFKKNTFIICLIIFLLSILLGMGSVSGFADIFFYTVPGLGGMHIYARYVPIFLFFLVFALTLGLSDIYKSDTKLNLKLPSIGIAVILLTILIFPAIFINNGISLPSLFAELFMSILVLLALHLRGNEKWAIALIPIIIFFQGSLMYMQENWISLSNNGNTYKDIVHNEARMSGLINYFYANTDKLFIKYIDLTPEIEKHGGVPHNFPWFIHYQPNDNRRISSYMGYDQGLAQQLEYAQKFSYYSQYDKNYLIDTGVDYIIYDRKTQEKEIPWLNTIVDQKIPEYDIGNGYFAVKVLQESTLRPKFDNGIFKVVSDDSNFKVDSFTTNWSTKTELKFNSSSNATLYFELFPHKTLKYYINGAEVTPGYSTSGIALFFFSPGENTFTVSYVNTPLAFFLYTYLLYIIIIFGIIIRYAYIYLKELKLLFFKK